MLTKSAGLATQVANGLVGTPPNAATQTEGAKPFPTCVAQPGTLPTPVIATPAYPNDPLPDAQRTAIASQNAAGLGYTVPPKTIDLAPQLDTSVKWQVTVGHADCSTERYLVSGDAINTFTSTLPKGSVVVDIFAPPSMDPRYPVGPAPSAPTPNVTRSSAAPPSTAKPTSR